jgi:hypothetical protein
MTARSWTASGSPADGLEDDGWPAQPLVSPVIKITADKYDSMLIFLR